MKSKISMILGIVAWGVLFLVMGISVLLAIGGGGTTSNALNVALGCPLCLCILSSLIGTGLGIASLLNSPALKESRAFAWWGIGLNGKQNDGQRQFAPTFRGLQASLGDNDDTITHQVP